MEEYRCRTLKPELSDWKAVSSHSVEDAANEYHAKSGYGARIKVARMAVVEVEGHGEFIARHFSYGIGRVGGIKPERMKAPRYYCDTFEQVSELLGVGVEKLIDDDYVGDERLEDEKDSDEALFSFRF